MTEALTHFELLISDVDALLRHHEKFKEEDSEEPGQPGRPKGEKGRYGPLLRSCVMLSYAAWEVYFEESMIEAVATLANRDPDDIPLATRDFLKSFRKTKDDPLMLAGDGWRDMLNEAVVERMIGRPDMPGNFGVNNANPEQVVTLQLQILGTSILDRCKWGAKNRDVDGVKSQLAKLVALRGEIAHKGRPEAGTKLGLATVRNAKNFFRTLAEVHDQELLAWLLTTSAQRRA